MNWPQIEIKNAARIVGGATPKSGTAKYWDGDIAWATPKDLAGLDGKQITDTPRKITSEGLKNCSAELLPIGSVLFSSRAPIGHIAINSIPMATNQGFKSFVSGPDLDASFLYWWLDANRSRLQALGNGATFKEVSKAVVGRILIPLPPLADQRRISTILDQADAVRRNRRNALCRLADLGQAIFYEMFGDPMTNPLGWDKVALVDCVSNKDDIRCGPFGTQLHQKEFKDVGVPLWGIKQVNRAFSIPTHEFVSDTKAKQLSNYDILSGDIVMTRKGTVGNCAVYPSDFPPGIMHSDLLRVRLNRSICEPEFIADQLHFSGDVQHQIELISGGAIMKGINVGRLKQIRVLRPPKSLQEEYMGRIHAIQSKAASAILHSSALDRLFASLQHRAFRGEL